MTTTLLLLANGFEVYEASAFIDVFGWAGDMGRQPVKMITAGLHPRLQCTFGFDVLPDIVISQDSDLTEFDALAVPGGFEEAGFYQDAYSERFLSIIKDFHSAGKPIASICVGALPVARCGILKGKPATTYHQSGGHRKLQLAEMGAEVQSDQIVTTDRIITSTSPATAIDVALLLLEMLTDHENARQVRTEMGF